MTKARRLRVEPTAYRLGPASNGPGFKEGQAIPAAVGDGRARAHMSRAPHRHAHSLISPAQMGHANRGRVLQVLFDLGPTSRAELARLIRVNRATITGIVQPLIDEGLLMEGAPLPAGGSGGKRARPLKFSPKARLVGAMEVQAGYVRSALVSWTGEVIAENRERFPVKGADPGPVIDAIVTCTSRTLAGSRQQPLGFGIAAAGMVDTDRGVIVKVNLAPILSGLALGPLLRERLGLPVYIDHHPRAMLLADRWFGAGRGARNFSALYVDDVLGGALLLDGHLHRGPSGAGGEFGHTFVQLDGDLCRCGRRGCWETVATTYWLRRAARAAGLPGAARMNARRLTGLAEADAPGANELLDRYARNIAVGVANLQQILAPNLFILHGDVVGGGERLRRAIEAHVHRLVPPRPGSDLQIALGDLGDRATLRGAAGLVLAHQLQFQL
jgi:predicted NBD/HSP70 family sugar kinase